MTILHHLVFLAWTIFNSNSRQQGNRYAIKTGPGERKKKTLVGYLPHLQAWQQLAGHGHPQSQPQCLLLCLNDLTSERGQRWIPFRQQASWFTSIPLGWISFLCCSHRHGKEVAVAATWGGNFGEPWLWVGSLEIAYEETSLLCLEFCFGISAANWKEVTKLRASWRRLILRCTC